MKKIALPIILLALSAHTGADSVDLALSSETVEASYRRGITDGISAVGSWLHQQGAIDVAGVGIYGGARRGDAGAFIGAKAFWVDANDARGQGIALGGAVAYELIPRVTVEANAHYAPKVTSYEDVESYQEWGARLTVQVLPVANVFVGFRDINVKVPVGGGRTDELDLMRGGYGGFTLYF